MFKYLLKNAKPPHLTLMIPINKIEKYTFWSLTKKLKEKFDNNYPIFDQIFQKYILQHPDIVCRYAPSEIK